MKKILLVLTAVMAILNASAQTAKQPSSKFAINNEPLKISKQQSKRGIPTIDSINYDAFDFNNFGSSSYGGFLWIMNSRYTIADTAGATSDFMKYAEVAYDSIFDYANNQPYLTTDYHGLTVNSIDFAAGWEQNSVNDDTTEVSIMEVNSKGFPTSIVLWDTMVFHSAGSSLNNQWNETTVVSVTPNFTLPAGQKHFAVKIQYFGDKIDTFAFGAGYPFNVNSCGSIQAAGKSTYYPNSFAYWIRFGQMLPTSTGGDVYTDCNQNGSFDATDGYNYIQNIDMTVGLTLDLTLGTNKTNPDVANSYVYPNPGGDNTSLYFTMPNASATSVVNVYDIAGKVVQSFNLGHLTAGKHQQVINTSGLGAGVYMYSIATDNGTAYGKFVRQ